jgi:hypothetical protein
MLTDSTTGLGKTAVAFGDITASYRRTRAARVAITAATLASATAAWSSGGWVEVDSTNEPGLYRFDVPDAAYASGVDTVVVTVKVTGALPVSKEILLVDWNKQVAAIPNVVFGAAGGLGDLQRWLGVVPNALSSGRVDSSVGAYPGNTAQTGDNYARIGANGAGLTALGDTRLANLDATVSSRSTFAGGAVASVTAAVTVGTNNDKTGYGLATDALNSTSLATSAVTELQTGLATAAAQTTAQTDLDDIQSRLPAALVSGRMDASVGAYPGNIPQTGDAYVRIGANGAGLSALGDTRLANLDATVSSRLATAGYTAPSTPPSASAIASQVRTELNVELARIDTNVGSRLAAAGYTAPSNTTIASNATILSNLATAFELDGAVYRLTTNALELAPTGSGGGSGLSQPQTVAAVVEGLTTYDVPTSAELDARTRLASEYALQSTLVGVAADYARRTGDYATAASITTLSNAVAAIPNAAQNAAAVALLDELQTLLITATHEQERTADAINYRLGNVLTHTRSVSIDGDGNATVGALEEV